jgi:hypothetical protein
MSSFNIKFQTSGLVPPPYACAVEIAIDKVHNGLNYTYELEYLDRESLSEEEIYEEGFSENDNLKFSGTLPLVWVTAFESLYDKTKPVYLTELKEEQAFWNIKTGENQMYPTNATSWENFLEEFKQAVLENKKVEAALHIKVKRIDEDGTAEYQIMAEFENRKLSIMQNKIEKVLAWNELSKLLKDYFAGELIPEKATENNPSKTGLYVDYGDGFWYQLGYALLTKPSKLTGWLL